MIAAHQGAVIGSQGEANPRGGAPGRGVNVSPPSRPPW